MLIFFFLSPFVELCTFFIDYQGTLVLVDTICRVTYFFSLVIKVFWLQYFFKYCTYNPYVLFLLGNWWFQYFFNYFTCNPCVLFYLVIQVQYFFQYLFFDYLQYNISHWLIFCRYSASVCLCRVRNFWKKPVRHQFLPTVHIFILYSLYSPFFSLFLQLLHFILVAADTAASGPPEAGKGNEARQGNKAW